jgi:hypothetical protein
VDSLRSSLLPFHDYHVLPAEVAGEGSEIDRTQRTFTPFVPFSACTLTGKAACAYPPDSACSPVGRRALTRRTTRGLSPFGTYQWPLLP